MRRWHRASPSQAFRLLGSQASTACQLERASAGSPSSSRRVASSHRTTMSVGHTNRASCNRRTRALRSWTPEESPGRLDGNEAIASTFSMFRHWALSSYIMSGFTHSIPLLARTCVPVRRTVLPFLGIMVPSSLRTFRKMPMMWSIFCTSRSCTLSIASSWMSWQKAIVRQLVPARTIRRARFA